VTSSSVFIQARHRLTQAAFVPIPGIEWNQLSDRFGITLKKFLKFVEAISSDPPRAG